MNFIAATVVLKSLLPDSVSAYGLSYRAADAVVPASRSNAEVKVRLLCYDNPGAKLNAFSSWAPESRALITGNLMFSDDPAAPFDLIVSTIETTVPQTMYCNQVVLGNAFFGSDEIQPRKNSMVATKIGSTLDNSDITTWLWLETHESRKKKLADRLRKGRVCCVHGYLREYRKDADNSPYRAIVATDFTTRAEKSSAAGNPQTNGTAAGYGELDPTPDY